MASALELTIAETLHRLPAVRHTGSAATDPTVASRRRASACVRPGPAASASVRGDTRVGTEDRLPAVVRLRPADDAGTRRRDRLWDAAVGVDADLPDRTVGRAADVLHAVVRDGDAATTSATLRAVVDTAFAVGLTDRSREGAGAARPASNDLTAVVDGCSAVLALACRRDGVRGASTRVVRAGDASVTAPATYCTAAIVLRLTATVVAPGPFRDALASSRGARLPKAAVVRANARSLAVVFGLPALVGTCNRVRLGRTRARGRPCINVQAWRAVRIGVDFSARLLRSVEACAVEIDADDGRATHTGPAHHEENGGEPQLAREPRNTHSGSHSSTACTGFEALGARLSKVGHHGDP
jgi:hypothetical protein